MKKYFVDTEFIEYPSTIDLISIGIVDEDGKQFYRVNKEANLDQASKWVIDNVLTLMPEYNTMINSFMNINPHVLKTRKQIALDILNFIDGNKPEFWGYYCDYDWVVFCWLFGPMVKLPNNFPMYCKDLKQWADRLNVDLTSCEILNHNALDDALWNKELYKALSDVEQQDKFRLAKLRETQS